MAVVACARVCMCVHAHGGVLVCLGFHFGQCTNPICMSLILDDVQALGSVCVMERMPVCQVEARQGTGPHPGEQSSCFAHGSRLCHQCPESGQSSDTLPQRTQIYWGPLSLIYMDAALIIQLIPYVKRLFSSAFPRSCEVKQFSFDTEFRQLQNNLG